MEKTCKTCKENDCGLCDRTGRLVDCWRIAYLRQNIREIQERIASKIQK